METKSPSTLAVVGAGAVGCYYGAHFSWSGLDTTFYARSGRPDLSDIGLTICSAESGTRVLRPFKLHAFEQAKPADLIFVSLKTTANHLVLPKILPRLLHPQSLVFSLQNGLGHEDELQQWLPAERIGSGLCFVCLNRLQPNLISHLGYGTMTLAETVPNYTRAKMLLKLWEKAGIPSVMAPDLTTARWKKLMWNIPFNGLAVAEGGKSVDQLLANPVTLRIVQALMEEVLLVGRSYGAELEEALPQQLINNTRTMGAYRPSTLIDWQNGLPLEIEAIFERPLRAAQVKNLECPQLQRLVQQLRKQANIRSVSTAT